MPDDFESKLLGFQRFILDARRKHNYDLSQIGNADQTALSFDFPYDRAIDKKGARTVSIATTGHEKSRFTVMLACMADGTKLPPFVVFKRKTLPREVNFPKGVHVRAHPKGWMKESLMRDWIRVVWANRIRLLPNMRSLLVLDDFVATERHLSRTGSKKTGLTWPSFQEG